jgi:TIR domain
MPGHSKQQSAPKVFISHAAVDNILARKVRNLLRSTFEANVSTTEDLSAGEDWESHLRRELAASDYVVALLAPQAVRSTFVLQDLGAAWALGKPIISLITRRDVLNSIPLSVNESQMIELTDVDDPGRTSDELVRRFSQIMGWHPAQQLHTPAEKRH